MVKRNALYNMFFFFLYVNRNTLYNLHLLTFSTKNWIWKFKFHIPWCYNLAFLLSNRNYNFYHEYYNTKGWRIHRLITFNDDTCLTGVLRLKLFWILGKKHLCSIIYCHVRSTSTCNIHDKRQNISRYFSTINESHFLPMIKKKKTNLIITAVLYIEWFGS